MDTRCYPAPPRRTEACSHSHDDAVDRAPRGRRWRRAALLVCSLVATLAGTVDASELERRIDESLMLCAAADQLPPEQRLAALARGLDLADTALALDERSARAHFAVVCSLGKATALGRAGFGTMKAVYRLRREIDITLTLAPGHAEAMAAKGALLMKLPRWLGGDRREAEHWLRRALAADPLNATARAYLDEIGATGPFVAPAADTALAP